MLREVGRISILMLLLVTGCRRSPVSLSPVQQSTELPAAPSGTQPPPSLSPVDRLNYNKPLAQVLGRERIDKSRISLRIEKSRFLLTVLYRGKPRKAYPVVFGRNPVDDKRREGDACTPEGVFHLTLVRPHRDWSKFMLLDYPNAASWQKFKAAQKMGEIPANATIGSAIGIHGVPEHADAAIEARQNWTLGCISLKRDDIDELYTICHKGTRVEIVH